MKKILILLGAVGVAMLVFIYTTSTSQKSQKYIYCEIRRYLDCEQGIILPEENKNLRFETTMDALNYYVRQGWEYVDVAGGSVIVRKILSKEEIQEIKPNS